MTEQELTAAAERVRTACIEAALHGYQLASMSGLCHEGAWEAAIDAMRRIDLAEVLNSSSPNEG